jgi:hypothetical protein
LEEEEAMEEEYSEDEMGDFLVEADDEVDEDGNLIRKAKKKKKKQSSTVKGVTSYALSEAQDIFGDTSDLMDLYNSRRKSVATEEAEVRVHLASVMYAAAWIVLRCRGCSVALRGCLGGGYSNHGLGCIIQPMKQPHLAVSYEVHCPPARIPPRGLPGHGAGYCPGGARSSESPSATRPKEPRG